MKTIHYLFVLVSFTFFVSCGDAEDFKLPDSKPKDENKYPVNFEVSGFKESYQDLKKSKTTKGINEVDSITVYPFIKLHGGGLYELYGSYNMRTYPLNEDGTVAITDSLKAGDYTFFFIGEDIQDSHNIQYSRASRTYIDPSWRGMRLNDYKKVVYYQSLEFTVSKTGSAIMHNVVLEKVVGKVEIVVKDARKASTSIQYIFPRIKSNIPILFSMANPETTYSRPVVNQRPQGPAFTEVSYGFFPSGYVSRDVFTSNDEYTFNIFLVNNSQLSESSDLWIEGILDVGAAPGNTTFSRSIKSGLKVYRNKITRITGSLFDENSTWNITYEDNWDGTDVVPF